MKGRQHKQEQIAAQILAFDRHAVNCQPGAEIHHAREQHGPDNAEEQKQIDCAFEAEAFLRPRRDRVGGFGRPSCCKDEVNNEEDGQQRKDMQTVFTNRCTVVQKKLTPLEKAEEKAADRPMA